ncbi:MAG: hypothetical protein HRU26_00930 [Psychroserpens sp.]|nr:hypothetical protein [Psychroserpens sp.]
MKVCKKCNCKKDVYEFAKNSKYKDGKFPWCKKCHLEYKQKRLQMHNEDTEFFSTDWQRKIWIKYFGYQTQVDTQRVLETSDFVGLNGYKTR